MKRIFSIFSKKQGSFGTAAFILMFMVVASALLGLVSKRVLNARFPSEETGIFLAAFRLPNLIFELLAMGALTSAFIPVFTKYITQGKEQEAHDMAATMMNGTLMFLLLLYIPLIIWAEPVSRLFAPGFTDTQIQQMTNYTRIMMVMQVIPLMIGNFLTGILQSYSLFLLPALAPVLYNVGLIIGVLWLAPQYGILSAVIGVGIGAILFFLIQVPGIFLVGYKHRWIFHRKQPGVREVMKLMLPRILGLGVSQIDVTIDLAMASILGPKMVVAFYLAQALQQMPVRLFGTTISQAALPMLSAATAKEEIVKFKTAMIQAYYMVVFFVLPVSVFFIILRTPIVRLLYGAAKFDWEDTVMTAMTLSMFSFSLVAQAVSQVIIRGFYALYDSKTPVVVSVITILLNSFFSVIFVLVLHWPVWSLGLSTSIASLANFGLLLFFLQRRFTHFSWKELLWVPTKMVLAAVVCAMVSYILLKLSDQLVFDTTRVFGLLVMTCFIGFVGSCVYMFISWVLGVGEVFAFFRLIERVKRIRDFMVQLM